MFNLFKRRRTKPAPRVKNHKRRLHIESLEQRQLMAGLEVVSQQGSWKFEDSHVYVLEGTTFRGGDAGVGTFGSVGQSSNRPGHQGASSASASIDFELYGSPDFVPNSVHVTGGAQASVGLSYPQFGNNALTAEAEAAFVGQLQLRIVPSEAGDYDGKPVLFGIGNPAGGVRNAEVHFTGPGFAASFTDSDYFTTVNKNFVARIGDVVTVSWSGHAHVATRQLTPGIHEQSVVSVGAGVGSLNSASPALNVAASADYVEGHDPVIVTPNATVADPDDFNVSSIQVQIAGGAAGDRLGIRRSEEGAGTFGFDGENLSYDGIGIGYVHVPESGHVLSIQFPARNATADAVTELLRNITFESTSESAAERIITFTLITDQRIEISAETRIKVQAVNDAPEIKSGSSVTFTENGPAVPVASNAVVSDADSANFAAGKLTFALSENAQATDRLAIRNAEGITVTGAYVRYNNSVIGAIASSGNGVGSKPLVVELNARATPAIVTLLAQCVTYSDTSENPAILPRTLSVSVTDGDGGVSNLLFKQIHVRAVNDAPKLAEISGRLSYTSNGTALALAPRATLRDADSSSFAGGRLLVRATKGANLTNRLEIGGPFRMRGNNIELNGKTIGVRDAKSNGVGVNLQIVFNAGATRKEIEALVRAVQFRTVKNTSTLDRAFEFSITDGAGGKSNKLTRTVEVAV